jgi:hypothetical protein
MKARDLTPGICLVFAGEVLAITDVSPADNGRVRISWDAAGRRMRDGVTLPGY